MSMTASDPSEWPIAGAHANGHDPKGLDCAIRSIVITDSV